MITEAVLPQELMDIIIMNVDTAAQLAQCSLVCKNWSYLAMKIMHTKMILVKSERGAVKLYGHLSRHPEKIESIVHLDFHLDSTDLSIIIEELLALAITPNIHKLTGFVKSDRFFKTLFKIIDDTPSELEKLVELPKYTGDNDALAIEQALRFKSMYDGLTIVARGYGRSEIFQCLLHQLDRFKNLTYLKLMGFAQGLQGIESVLKRSSRLKTLEIQNFEYDSCNMRYMPTTEVKHWAAAKVKRGKSLQTLIVESACRPEFIDYLMFKYPTITNLKITGQLVYFASDCKTSIIHDLNRIFDAVAKVRCKEITLIIPGYYEPWDVAPSLRNHSENIIFHFKEDRGQRNLVLKYSVNKLST
ncbi:hypothetical protein [Parasitella parasitica]|uniref:F-box domain-containing protein n=1 Tax=Parasitella parasitica TaxID=35722 RepID=A0A0B7MUJ2_9FUNG|nr:hypothetical protein [Parasitella parasitica]